MAARSTLDQWVSPSWGENLGQWVARSNASPSPEPGRGGGILIWQVPGPRGERQRVMEAIEEVTDLVAGRRCPLCRPHREVRGPVEVGGELVYAGPVAKAKELGLNVHLLGLLNGAHALTGMASLEDNLSSGGGGRPQLAADVVDARGIGVPVDHRQAFRLRVGSGGVCDLG